ncbi:MAG: HD-GYP domain-containing protein [Lachnospiraceae bacterium]|nr:HD-GYP domain-containing protein [Lachnospiraceae bacterium]
MFFTNGGAEGGTPIWLLLGTIYIALILEGKLKVIMLVSEAVIIIGCWILGYYGYVDKISYTQGQNYFDSIAGLFIISGVIYAMISFQSTLNKREEEQKNVQRLFAQTATALVNAIDAKDRYTHGHSGRVAAYSQKIAQLAGKTPAECDEIYYVALLHDVGKIGIPEYIINKEDKLTDEEYEVVKQHSALGAQILQSITEFPYISIGAHFHHERYDGKGYPKGLKGNDIPEIARIISVADAYDAMTSKRSYRDAIPQEKVREELIEGNGTQFDPEFTNIMLHLIDLDTEFEMKEREEIRDLSGKDGIVIGKHRSDVTEGILVTPNMTSIKLKVSNDKNSPGHIMKPSMILFDSIDGRYHNLENDREAVLYYEYAEIQFDGQIDDRGVRKTETKISGSGDHTLTLSQYIIEAVKYNDHAKIKIISKDKAIEMILALPDSTRYIYIGLTGEYCHISNVNITKSDVAIGADHIPRIAEEISYINVPAGDIPNVQVDGYRSDLTKGIPIKDGMTITFHAQSLPTARLVWHCPSYVIFSSDDGTVKGGNYMEFSLVRLDGETWEGENLAENELIVDRHNSEGWDSWKKFNKDGFECTVRFTRDGGHIVSSTENAGISIRNITDVKVVTDEIYVALSGDQCALTNIRING